MKKYNTIDFRKVSVYFQYEPDNMKIIIYSDKNNFLKYTQKCINGYIITKDKIPVHNIKIKDKYFKVYIYTDITKFNKMATKLINMYSCYEFLKTFRKNHLRKIS